MFPKSDGINTWLKEIKSVGRYYPEKLFHTI
jgi:hypothetical protein